MKEELVYLGVDIAKSYLDAAIGNEKGRFGKKQKLGTKKKMKDYCVSGLEACPNT